MRRAGRERARTAPSRRRAAPTLALGLAMASPAVVLGQAADSTRAGTARALPDAPPVSLPDLRVTVRRPAEIGTVRTIPELAALPLRDLGDWLRQLPGVRVRSRGFGGRTTLSIRGSRPSEVRVRLDGISLEDPLTGEIDLSLLPAATLASVSLRPGSAASAGWGGGAGTLDLRSREGAAGVEVGGGVGSYGRAESFVAIHGRPDPWRISLFGRLETGRNDFPFRNRLLPGRPVERRINADATRWSGLGRLDLTGVPLGLLARVDAVERGVPGRMATHLWDRARWHERNVMLAIRWGEVGSPGTGERPGAGRGRTVSWSRRRQRYLDPGPGRDDRWVADALRAAGDEELAGVQVSWETSWSRVTGGVIDGPRTRLTGSLRARRAFLAGAHLTLAPELGLAAGAGEFAISPGLGVAWTPDPATRVWARAGQAFRLPTFADLFLGPGAGTRPNPDLVPERVWLDAETGLERISPSGRWRWRSVAFLRATRDPIVWLPSVVSIWFPRNLGSLSALGLELEGSLALDSRLRLSGMATLQRTRIGLGETSTPLPYEPGVFGRAGLEYRTASTRGGIELEWSGRRRTDLFAPHTLSPFGLLNIRGGQTFHLAGMEAEVGAAVLNAFGTAYERVELFPEPGRRFEFSVRFGGGRRSRLPPRARGRRLDPSRRETEENAGEADGTARPESRNTDVNGSFDQGEDAW